jgi:hypothetical protein
MSRAVANRAQYPVEAVGTTLNTAVGTALGILAQPPAVQAPAPVQDTTADVHSLTRTLGQRRNGDGHVVEGG